MSDREHQRQAHNQQQVGYFSSRTKATMVPNATPYVLRQIDRTVSFAGIKKGDTILEVGCGMGRYTFSLAERGFHVHGLDLTRFLLDKLAAYNGGRYDIPFYCTDIVEYPSELAERFDAVVGFFVLHHLHDMDACFGAMAEMVRPGGCIVFLEPNPFNPLYYLQILITPGMTWEGDGGIVLVRRRMLFDVMRRAGLADLELIRLGFFPPFVTNRRCGSALESILERVPIWRPFLPFQLIKGIKKRTG